MDGTDGAVVLINLFEVPPGADEGFVAGWERARDFLQGQDGYLSTELHRSLAADADFRSSTSAATRARRRSRRRCATPTSSAPPRPSRTGRTLACTR
jgi:antibiotic biosynthesis monooxygenase